LILCWRLAHQIPEVPTVNGWTRVQSGVSDFAWQSAGIKKITGWLAESQLKSGQEDGTSSALGCRLWSTSPMTVNEQEKHALTEAHPSSVGQAGRTAIAAVVSLLVARFFDLPEAYWSAITTVIVMQSTLGAALPISVRRFIGTAVGAVVGALVDVYFPGSALALGIAVFATGVICALLRVERGTFRYASITLPRVAKVDGWWQWIASSRSPSESAWDWLFPQSGPKARAR